VGSRVSVVLTISQPLAEREPAGSASSASSEGGGEASRREELEVTVRCRRRNSSARAASIDVRRKVSGQVGAVRLAREGESSRERDASNQVREGTLGRTVGRRFRVGGGVQGGEMEEAEGVGEEGGREGTAGSSSSQSKDEAELLDGLRVSGCGFGRLGGVSGCGFGRLGGVSAGAWRKKGR
jgi:hypothetical protein